MAICEWPTLEEVKAELGITGTEQDAFLTRSIAASIGAIEGYVHRKLPQQLESETFYITDCDKCIGYIHRLQLKRWPIVSVTTCLDGSGNAVEYSIDEGGMLCGTFMTSDKIIVDYEGGLDCASEAFNIALDVFWDMVTYRNSKYGEVATASDVKKESVPGVYTIEYHSPTSTEGSVTASSAKYYEGSLSLLRTYFA